MADLHKRLLAVAEKHQRRLASEARVPVTQEYRDEAAALLVGDGVRAGDAMNRAIGAWVAVQEAPNG